MGRLAVLAALALGAGCAGEPAAPPSPADPATTAPATAAPGTTAPVGTVPPAAGGVRAHDFRAHAFAADSCPPGAGATTYRVAPEPLTGPIEPDQVRLDAVTYGSLGGAELALVQLVCPGARGVGHAALYAEDGARVAVAAPDEAMTARLAAQGVEAFSLISAGFVPGAPQVRVEGSGYLATDAGCCPSFTVVFTLSSGGGAVVAAGEQLTRRS
jgi:hypothetical protein